MDMKTSRDILYKFLLLVGNCKRNAEPKAIEISLFLLKPESLEQADHAEGRLTDQDAAISNVQL